MRDQRVQTGAAITTIIDHILDSAERHLPSSLRQSTRGVMRCCAAEMAPHRNPPLPSRIQQPKTAGANSKLDKTWGKVTVNSRTEVEITGKPCPHFAKTRRRSLLASRTQTEQCAEQPSTAYLLELR
jgi:hypothetical protein